MKIQVSNLPALVGKSVEEDLAIVKRLASGRGVPLPDVEFRIAALACPELPANLPENSVDPPADEVPVSFHKRCDWETRRQSFEIVESGGAVWVIAGDAEGALRGFGEALQCLSGVIWGGLTDEDILFGKTRPLPRGVQSPRFAYRCRDGYPPDGSEEAFIKWLSRNKYNARAFISSQRHAMNASDLQQLNDLLAARCIHQIVGYHDMDFWLPQEVLEKHREWCGMRDGRRILRGPVEMPDVPDLNAELPIQPCYSNPDVAEFIVTRMADHIADHPEIEIFSIWPYDGVNNWCQCEDCLRKTPYEHMVDLTLGLLPRIPETMPVELIVYSNLLNLPFQELPRSERIISMMCPYLRHFKHRIYERGGPPTPVTGTAYPEPDRINPLDEREYGLLFEQWRNVWKRSGAVPGIFEYAGTFPDETRRTDFTRYLCLPEPQLRVDEARWYANKGVRYFYMCGMYKGWPDNFLQLSFNRTMWGAEEPVDDFALRYYEALLGRNGPDVFRALEEVARRLHREAEWRDALERLQNTIAHLPDSSQKHRYQLWCQYVNTARPAREYEVAGELQAAAAQEERVIAFLEENRKLLVHHVPVDCLLNLSRTFKRRFLEKLMGEGGSDYQL